MPPDAHELPALLDRYERPLVSYARSIVGDLESARDVVQETFIKWTQRNGADHAEPAPPAASNPEAWLFTVTRNRALDVLRKNSRIIPMTFPDERPSEAPGPASVLESRDAEQSLLRLLDELTPNQSEVIRLKFQNDLSYREIADITQLSVTNVGFLLHTGLKKLRTLLAERATEDFGFPIRQVL